MNQTIEALDQRAEDMWTHILAGRASSADIAEYERTTTALQDALCAPRTDEPVVLPDADDWLMSYAARDFLPESEG